METLVVPGTLHSLGAIGKYVMDAAAAARLEKKAAYRLRLAVDEIATNALVHGHAGAERQGILGVRAEVDRRSLTIILEDAGAPYDPRQVPPPRSLEAPLEERPVGGLGVYLALQNVDEFFYER